MGVSALGVLLSKLRERRGLDLRELATLVELDRSYIYRLETGDRSTPSPDAFEKLLKILKANSRDRQIAEVVLRHPTMLPSLVALSMDDEGREIDLLELAAVAAFRGTGEQDPKVLFERARVAREAMKGI
jgi:transcriptional regulator with XRE-family HTH domain